MTWREGSNQAGFSIVGLHKIHHDDIPQVLTGKLAQELKECAHNMHKNLTSVLLEHMQEGVELILKESIRINFAMEDKKKEEDDWTKGKDGRGRKSDHRLGRNFYKGLFGDSINVMLAAAAYNLKRAMRLFLCLFKWVIRRLMTEGQWSVITYKAFTCAHLRSF